LSASKYYTLTARADKDLAELKAWSGARWGDELTQRYMADIHKGVERIAKSYKTLRSRSEFSAGTDLSIYPVREHYIIFYPTAKEHIVIVAVLRQGRDIPGILRANSVDIDRALKKIRSKVQSKKLPRSNKA